MSRSEHLIATEELELMTKKETVDFCQQLLIA